VGVNIQVTPELPDQLSRLRVLEQILQRYLITHGVHTVLQVLVKWSSSLDLLAT
jgi:hypothetical protein